MFTRSVVTFEKDDRVVADLHRQIRSFYLPPVNVSSAVTSHVWNIYFIFLRTIIKRLIKVDTYHKKILIN